MNNICMNLRRFSLLIMGVFTLLCPNLRQVYAQSLQVPMTQGAPAISITPTTPPVVTPPAPGMPASTGPVLSTTSSFDVTKVKYFEFKSICVRDEVEPSSMMSATVKEKRVALIQSKLEKAQAEKNQALIQQIKALLIREYIKQDNYAKAEDIFQREGAYLNESDRILIASDIDLHKNAAKQAKNNLNKYLETHPKDSQALEKLATVYTLLGSYTDAMLAYEDLQKLHPKKNYYEVLCQNAMLNADHANVIQFCHKLKKIDPKNTVADIYLGISLRDQEKYGEAIKSFERSLKIKPTEYASTCLAESFYLNKELSKALVQYEQSVKIKPTSRRAHLGLANTYIKQNMYREALEEFKQSCKLGLVPITEMSAAGNTLKGQKSDLANSYFDEIQRCKR